MSLIQTHLRQLAQQNYLQRAFFEALVPNVKFLAAAPYEEMMGGNGETIIKTVAGVKEPAMTPLKPGKDLTPTPTSYEHFVTSIDQFGGSDDIPLLQAYATIEQTAGYYIQKMGEMAVQCATTLNLLVRNAIYKSYLAGNAITYQATANTTTLYLNTLNGFYKLVVNGQPTTISAQNPLTITIGTQTRQAIGFEPEDANEPDGPGTLTLSAAVTCDADTPVLASNRSRILRPNMAQFDQLQPNDVAYVDLFQRAVAELDNNFVKPMNDGFYHVHCAPFILQQLSNDNKYERFFEGRGPNDYLPDGSVGTISNLKFFNNNQCPQPGLRNSGTPITVPTRGTLLPTQYCGELYTKEGVQVHRSVVMGRKAVSQLYVDERKAMIAEAGYIGSQQQSFAMVGEQLQMMAGAGAMGNVRIIIRPPIDRAGQQMAISWTATRGFAVFANLLSGQSNANFKRAMVVETGFQSLG